MRELTQLRAHIGGALNIGVTEQRGGEVITQVAMYAGFPAALNAMAVADECFAASTRSRANELLSRALDSLGWGRWGCPCSQAGTEYRP